MSDQAIGGVDVILSAVGDAASLDICVRVAGVLWPHARFEDADTGERYASYADVPFGRISGLFVYRDLAAQFSWDSDAEEANTMVYLIRHPGAITVVVDDPAALGGMLEGMRTMLETDNERNR